MRRQHRRNLNIPGHAHELTFSCYRRYPFFRAERTCQWLAEATDHARRREDFQLWAYVFMPDHIHLILWPRASCYDIASIRKAIKEPVARTALKYLKLNSPAWLAKLTRTRGVKTERLFWQSGGGYDRNIFESATLLKMIDYVHANPVRKKLAQRPADWKWSSAAWFGNGTEIPLAVDPIPKDWMMDH